MKLEIKDKQNKTYVILGAPHSGTSFLAKALRDAGVDIGTDLYKYQDRDIVKLNYTILKKAGGGPYNPPSERSILATNYNHHIKNAIKRRQKKFWGWKEPTTSLTIKKYLPHLEEDVYLICIFRKPESLVKSYEGREGGRITKKLIDRYNKSILSALKKFCGL